MDFSSIYNLNTIFELVSIGLSFVGGKVLSYFVQKNIPLSLRKASSVFSSGFFFYLMTILLQILMIPIFSFGLHFSTSLIQISIVALVALMMNTLLKNSVIKIFVSFLIWSLFLLHVTGLMQPVVSCLSNISINFGSNSFNLLGVLKAIFVTSVLVSIAISFTKYLERCLEKQKQLALSARLILAKFIKTILIILALLIGISLFGIDLSIFSFFAGAIGVGIAFSLQNILSNWFSGFILLMDHSIKPGDVISIGDGKVYGIVNKLHARYVSIRTREGKEHLIPNQFIIANKLENWSYSDPHIRVEISFKVSIDSDLLLVEKLLKEIALSAKRVIDHPIPTVRFRALNENGVDLLLRFWNSDPQNGMSDIRSEIILNSLKAFHKHGIRVPLPPREIHNRSVDEN